MIGGVDIVIPAVGDAAALEACARIVQRYWPHAAFEDAETGEKYSRYSDIPLARMHELFIYSNAETEVGWDAGHDDVPPNSMLYLILSPGFVTVVLDDPDATNMPAMLESFRTILLPLQWMDVNTEARAA